MTAKKTVKKPNRVIEATVNMNTTEAINLKPVAWAIVFASLLFAGTMILMHEYSIKRGCAISYLDNSGMLLNSCDMYDETN